MPAFTLRSPNQTTKIITHKSCIPQPMLSNDNSKTTSNAYQMLTMCLVLLFTYINSFNLDDDSIMSYIPCGSQSPYASMENSREGLLYEEISEQDG